MSRHIPTAIKPGSHYDHVLRVLCGGWDWRTANLDDLDWHTLPQIGQATRLYAVSTYISTCRHFLELERGYTIRCEMLVDPDTRARHSRYRIEPLASTASTSPQPGGRHDRLSPCAAPTMGSLDTHGGQNSGLGAFDSRSADQKPAATGAARIEAHQAKSAHPGLLF